MMAGSMAVDPSSVVEWVARMAGLLADEYVGELVGKLVDQFVGQLVGQLVGQVVTQLINEFWITISKFIHF